MGCWNGTCGISQLPILHGEKIRVFILKPSHGTGKFITEPNSFVYSTDMFDALGIPFVAEYNDYGTVENIIENYNTEILHKELANMVVLPKNKPFSKGDIIIKNENKYYNTFEITAINDDMASIKKSHEVDQDIKIVPISDIRHYNRENFYDDIGNLENVINLIERNVFEINNSVWVQFGLNKTAIPGLFYVRENIWQAMIADIEEESEYAFGHKSRKTWLKFIDSFIDDIKKAINEMSIDDKTKNNLWLFILSSRLESLDKNNPVGRMFDICSTIFSAELYKHILIESIKNDNIDFAKQIMEDILDTTTFLSAMLWLIFVNHLFHNAAKAANVSVKNIMRL